MATAGPQYQTARGPFHTHHFQYYCSRTSSAPTSLRSFLYHTTIGVVGRRRSFYQTERGHPIKLYRSNTLKSGHLILHIGIPDQTSTITTCVCMSVCSVFVFFYTHYLHCMFHYTLVTLHAWLSHFFPVLCFLLLYNGILTSCPFAFIFCCLVPYSVFTNFSISFIFSLFPYSLFNTILLVNRLQLL